MLGGFCLQIVTANTGWAAIGTLPFWLGLLAFVYAYRKQPPQRAAEKQWWREFDQLHQSTEPGSRETMKNKPIFLLAIVFFVLGGLGLAFDAMESTYRETPPIASLTFIVLGTACVMFRAYLQK